MIKTTIQIQNLLYAFPDEKQELLPYVDRAHHYSTECGCSLGAKFLLAAMLLLVIYFALFHDFGLENLIYQILLSIGFLFASSIVGKLIGIGIARIKLALLYRYLVTRFHAQGE